jgi:chromosome segregation ATPase
MHHINATNRLREYEAEVVDLRRANSILHQKASTISAQNSGLQQSMQDTQQHLQTSNQEHSSFELTMQHQIESAAELAERQNALIVTLEAKVYCCDHNISTCVLVGLQNILL